MICKQFPGSESKIRGRGALRKQTKRKTHSEEWVHFVVFNSGLPVFPNQWETKGRELVALMLLEAGAAVDGPVVTGLERNLGGGAAVCAHGVKHFALAIAGGLPGGSAVLAADGLILETLLSVELLLASRKDEFLTAILTNQCLVFEHLCFPLR